MFILTVLLFGFGAIVGSFLNVLILRLPNEEKITGRSHCPTCHSTLSSLELVPLFSFLFLRGKCKNCGVKISWRYFFIELTTGVLFALSWFLLMPASTVEFLLLLKILFVVSIFLVVFVVDFEHYIILDSVTLFGVAVALVLNFFLDFFGGNGFTLHGNFVSGLLGAITAPLPFFFLWYFSKGAWMGFGDVKLAILLGIVFGFPLWIVNFMLAIFLGGAISVVLLIAKTKKLKSQVPFGTFLTLSGVITLFYGKQLLDWYLSLLGI